METNIFFKVLYQSKKRGSKARLGEIVTAHGKIKTPAFMAAGTKGTVKSLLPWLLKEIGVQVAFVNTYHLVTHPGVEIIEKAGGIHRYASLNLPLMSDSGGFQVFSLAKSKNFGSKFLSSVNSSPSKSEDSSNIHFRKNFFPSFNQYLYGVIQGGVFEDLRKKSAEFVVSQNTEGVAIGGVSIPYFTKSKISSNSPTPKR